jgi:hypothetical protein
MIVHQNNSNTPEVNISILNLSRSACACFFESSSGVDFVPGVVLLWPGS